MVTFTLIMKKIISYIYPVTKKIPSKYSGDLEITWYNGKKHLNTKNANYSYGALQRILKYSLEKINLKNTRSILVLGLGGGSVIETLRNDFNYNNHITAVDIDPEIIKIAKDEFELIASKNLNIICDDALHFVAQNKEKYDLIIIDLFIDIVVPAPFLELDFWANVLHLRSSSATIIFNASLESSISHKLKNIISYLKSHVYEVVVHDKVNNTNTIIIAKSL